ncbi:MAG: hypothetical protein EB058_14855, partial [Proteobacteria bacterium]|nr:hypothetical protein [Pseudomonadota bacterium]
MVLAIFSLRTVSDRARIDRRFIVSTEAGPGVPLQIGVRFPAGNAGGRDTFGSHPRWPVGPGWCYGGAQGGDDLMVGSGATTAQSGGGHMPGTGFPAGDDGSPHRLIVVDPHWEA